MIETRPTVGTSMDKGSNVTIVVSSGKQRVTVPKVTDLDQDEARSTLEALGFQVTTTPKETADEDPGTVLTQAPAANTKAAKGATVTLTVAKAPPEVDVPNVTGQGRLAAQQALQAAGFKVTLVPQTTDRQDAGPARDQPGPRVRQGEEGLDRDHHLRPVPGGHEHAVDHDAGQHDRARHHDDRGDEPVRVAVLGGGRSSEHDVSLTSAGDGPPGPARRRPRRGRR